MEAALVWKVGIQAMSLGESGDREDFDYADSFRASVPLGLRDLS